MALVEIDIRDRVMVITLNRPERRNALTLELSSALAAAVEDAGRREDVHALVVTGTNGAFCAGADRTILASPDAKSLRQIYSAFHAVRDCPVPTVAAVGGPAIGAGMNLTLAADVRIVSPRAVLDPRFLGIPVHPGGGHFWMLDRAASPQATAAMTLLGQALDGEAAVRHGIAWECVRDDELVERARALCARAASTPRALVVQAKAAWRYEATMPELPAASELELGMQLASMDTEEYRRAMGGPR